MASVTYLLTIYISATYLAKLAEGHRSLTKTAKSGAQILNTFMASLPPTLPDLYWGGNP